MDEETITPQPREHPVICTMCLTVRTMAHDAICDTCRPIVNRRNAERRVAR